MGEKMKIKKIIFILILIISAVGLTISVVNVIKLSKHSSETVTKIEEINNIVKIEEKPDDENVEIIEQEEKPKKNIYWDYIKLNILNVDFSELKKINSRVKGWLQVKGTNVNYPFVQADNNDFYINHSFDKTYNEAGWIFADYRNKLDGTDKHIIIYGHALLNKAMFGSLKLITENGWLKQEENFIIKMSSEKENTLWQVFSVYHIPTTSDYLQTNFIDNDDFMNFIELIKERSVYDFETSVSENDKILTLSTCYNKKERTVIHAKLIKKETR